MLSIILRLLKLIYSSAMLSDSHS